MNRRCAARTLSFVLVPLAVLTPRAASAFTLSSAITDGCHEEITENALRSVRATAPHSLIIAADRNEQALIDDLPFDVPADMNELAAASLLVGVRDNDLKGRSPTEIDQLATVHGNPNNQEEHCLRAADEDEPDGTTRALEHCKTFIHDRAMQAVDALDANSVPIPSQRMDIDVSLSLRGRVTASLPAFWIRIGQAMHALQDSFAHEYRTSDGSQITVTLNWIDFVNKTESEPRDGPVHKTDLDKCNGGDPIQTRNKALAIEASTALLMAVLDEQTSRDQKSDAVNAVLARYLDYSPGCTFANAWCNAAENKYTNATGCGCVLAGGGGGDGLASGIGLGALAFAVVARRRARKARAVALAAGPLAFALFFAAPNARAQTAEAATTPAPSGSSTTPAAPPMTPSQSKALEAPKQNSDETTPAPTGVVDKNTPNAEPITPRTVAEAKDAVKEEEHSSPFALSANIGGSIVDAGAAGSIGMRYRLNKSFVIGLDGELNYWYGVNSGRFDAGATSVYATGIYRIPLRYEPINLRTTVHLGGSYELLDLYGVPSGSVGLFAGLFPLGIEWKATGHVFLIFNPLGIAIPIPHLTGAPFAYPQFRTQIGVEVSL